MLSDLKIGDSVSIDGTCLTVTEINPGIFRSQVSLSTFNTTKIKHCRPGAVINLERALRVNSRVGGHFVQGHVETTGRILKFLRSPGNSTLEIHIPKNFLSGIAVKGYVAVDGISLTVRSKKHLSIDIIVIEETFRSTNLKHARPGQYVNIERDYMPLTHGGTK